MVHNESVEQACSEVSEYSDDRMMAEFSRFFEEQPAVCDFVVEATNNSEPEIQEMSLFLAYMIFKALKCNGPDAVDAITPQMIESAYHECESWIDELSQTDDSQVEVVSERLKEETEPYLIQYVIAELNRPDSDGVVLEDEEKGEVFFLLRTVISSLGRRTE